MIFWIYNLALLLLSPLVVLFVLYRIFVSKKSDKAWRDQLGLVNVPREIADKKPVWIHAVSVGESVASAAVVAELKAMSPETPVVVSTTTQTGRSQAEKSIKNADAFIYYPFDLLPCVANSIRQVNPSVFASTDTEIWPNFRHVLRSRNVRSALINGTISDHTLNGAAKLPWLYRWALGNMDVFCMQSLEDAERVISIGANPAKVTVTGNIKWDQALSDLDGLDIELLRQRYKVTEGTPVFVAGSTNPGEDAPIMDAFLAVRKDIPDLRVIIAPRQIERRGEIVQLAQDRGLSSSWRSEPDTITGKEDVIILDTFGELAKIYALAQVTFVGGSLIPRGCHSILQPITLGKPVFFGPHTFKARDVTSQAERAGVGFRIHSADELGTQMIALLSDSDKLIDIERRCRQLVDANHGAAVKTAEALLRV
jgi:3-deoxy-D-manno-octulosonic-acid transferase